MKNFQTNQGCTTRGINNITSLKIQKSFLKPCLTLNYKGNFNEKNEKSKTCVEKARISYKNINRKLPDRNVPQRQPHSR